MMGEDTLIVHNGIAGGLVDLISVRAIVNSDKQIYYLCLQVLRYTNCYR